jgi:hypothetical protein
MIDHRAHRVLDRQERSREVDVQRPSPDRKVEVADRRVLPEQLHTGVGDRDVDVTGPFPQTGERAGHGALVGHVGLVRVRVRLAVEFRDGRRGTVPVAVHERDHGALARESHGHRPADPGCGPGDEGGPAGQPAAHAVTPRP